LLRVTGRVGERHERLGCLDNVVALFHKIEVGLRIVFDGIGEFMLFGHGGLSSIYRRFSFSRVDRRRGRRNRGIGFGGLAGGLSSSSLVGCGRR
jgi:hypothetical protein